LKWSDSIDQAPEMEKAHSSMPGKRARPSEGQKGHIPKRRQVCKWHPHEEEALRKAVKEYEFSFIRFGIQVWLFIIYLSNTSHPSPFQTVKNCCSSQLPGNSLIYKTQEYNSGYIDS
jgi:hypothetical protein